MPLHDWTRVYPGIFDHLHLQWIAALTCLLNQRLLPSEYYALIEPQAAGYGPDHEFHRRKQNVVAVRHVSGDSLVAIIEIVSTGNKAGRKAFDDFVRKAAESLSHQVHLLVVDLQPTTTRDPNGIHGAIWDEVAGDRYVRPGDKPLTVAAYESGAVARAFVEPMAVGDTLVNMPLFLEPGRYVAVPLEETYQTAFAAVPRRWRALLEQP
jgi:hypothetical protein